MTVSAQFALLPENRASLEKRFPELLARLESALDAPADGTGASPAWPGGHFALERESAPGETVLEFPYGRRDAHALVQRWAARYGDCERFVYAVTGLGDASHVRALLERFGDHSYVFVAEPDVRLAAELLARCDLSDLLQDRRFHLGVGEPEDGFFRTLMEIGLHQVNNAHPLIFGPLFSLAPDYYRRFFTEFARAYDLAHKLFFTNVQDSGLWQGTTLKNLPLLMDAPDIGSSDGIFAGLPLVLVGAGPSLDLSFDFLRRIQGHAVIAASNTPYRALRREGIVPDVLVSVDPREHAARGYKDQELEGVPIVVPFYVNEAIATAFAGRAFTWSSHNALVSVFRKRLGLPPGSQVAELGTVSASILDLARRWGCPKVCLVAQDMAILDNGDYHHRDTFYADMKGDNISVEGCRRMPGNTRASVYVEAKLFAFKKIFEDIIAQTGGACSYINTAPYGVQVKGAPFYTFEQAEEWIGQGHGSDARQRLLAILEESGLRDQPVLPRLESALRPLEAFVRKVLDKTSEAVETIDSLPEKLSAANYARHRDIERCERLAAEVNALLDTHPQDYLILFDGETKNNLARYSREVGALQHDQEHWERQWRNRAYFMALKLGAQTLLDRLESCFEIAAVRDRQF